MATAPISYGNEYSTDLNAIERNRKYAELLQQQSMQPSETNQMAGGWVIPTPKTAGLAKVLQGIGGIVGNRMADQKEKALSEKYQSDLQSTFADAIKARDGTPAMNTQPANAVDDQGNPMPQVNTPAVPGNNKTYAAILMRHPALQQMGMQEMQKSSDADMLSNILTGGAPNSAGSSAPPPAGGAPAPTDGSAPPAPAGNMPGLPPLSPQTQAGLLGQLSPQDQALALGYAKTGDKAGLFKLIEDRLKPHVTADGKAITTLRGQVQVLPGSVQAMQDYANVQTPLQTQQMDQNAMQMYQAKNVDLPGYSKGVKIQQQGGQQPSGAMPGYMGPQPNGRFQGDPQAIMAQIQNVPDPNERAAAMQAMRNQMSGQNPNQAVADRAGTPAMMGQPAVGPGMTTSAPPPQIQQPSSMPPTLPQNGGGGLTAPSNLSPDQVRELAAKNAEKFQGGRLENMKDYEKGLNARVTEGGNLNMRMQESINALNQFKAGGGAETYQKMAQVAQGLGMPAEVVNGLMGGGPGALAASQVFSKLAAQEAMETLKQSMGGAGRIAQAEFKVFQQNNPNINTDPEAIRKIFDFNTRVYKSDLAEQNAFGQFVQKNNPADFPAYWARESQKLGFTNPGLSAQPAPQAAPQRRAADAVPVKRFNPATGKIE